MMTVEQLRENRTIGQAAFQEFALTVGSKNDYLFCFFEGKDNPYYVPRVKRIVNEKFYPIKCGNRDKVLDVHRLIAAQSVYQKYKKAFFIDRDFNPPLSEKTPPLFETPCYSIENLYVTLNVFKQVLANEFHISETSENDLFQLCVDLYVQRQLEFHESITLFNAWYACLIDNRNATGQVTGVSLDEKLPKGFLLLSLEKIEANYDENTLKTQFPDATMISAEALNEKLTQFRNCNPTNTFRGKYELQFFLTFIQHLLQDANSVQKQKYIKRKINYAFGDATGINQQQALSIFSGYAETPDSLLEYLANASL